jgi:hypothetical protein
VRLAHPDGGVHVRHRSVWGGGRSWRRSAPAAPTTAYPSVRGRGAEPSGKAVALQFWLLARGAHPITRTFPPRALRHRPQCRGPVSVAM